MENLSEEDFFIERKIRYVDKEFETGFNSYQRVEAKVATLHQWTVTINLGFIIYMATYNNHLTHLSIILMGCMIIFLLLELRARSSMAFDKTNILEIEDICNEKTRSKYIKRIQEYKFREEKLKELIACQKFKCYFCSVKKGEVIVWYSMWFLIWVIFIFLMRHSWFVKNIWIVAPIALAFFVFYIFLICKYFKKNK